MKANHKIKNMVVYVILKGGTLSFITTHPEAFHYDDDYLINNDGVIKWRNKESHQKTWHKKPPEKKRVNANCLASIKMVGLMCVRRCKKRDRNVF